MVQPADDSDRNPAATAMLGGDVRVDSVHPRPDRLPTSSATHPDVPGPGRHRSDRPDVSLHSPGATIVVEVGQRSARSRALQSCCCRPSLCRRWWDAPPVRRRRVAREARLLHLQTEPRSRKVGARIRSAATLSGRPRRPHLPHQHLSGSRCGSPRSDAGEAFHVRADDARPMPAVGPSRSSRDTDPHRPHQPGEAHGGVGGTASWNRKPR